MTNEEFRMTSAFKSGLGRGKRELSAGEASRLPLRWVRMGLGRGKRELSRGGASGKRSWEASRLPLRWVILLFWGVLGMGSSLMAAALSEAEWGTEAVEADYYRLVELAVPEGLVVEAGSFDWLPDGRLAVGTRRGDLYLVSGVDDEYPKPVYHCYASGLDEILGLAYRDGVFYVTQQTEVTKITDLDGDERADRFETVSDIWGFENYHEFGVGSKFDHDGNLWVALCLSQSYHSKALFRGWALKITPEGETIPVCSGIRSPLGIGMNPQGAMFYAESQGPWNGSCSLKHLRPGGFMGHPISFNWYPYAPHMGAAPKEPETRSRLVVERERIPELVPYSVVFPYRKMGQSISGFVVDRSEGKFGPFADQLFIGDYTLSLIMRATMEEVNGVWQGACYPFREGLSTGILNLQFTPKGRLIAGGTNRGWPVRGDKENVLERLEWTGRVPFEIKEINAMPKGFKLTFTEAVDAEVASDPANYSLRAFTHVYQQGYGSPEVDESFPKVTAVKLSDDRTAVEVEVDGLVRGHVHGFYLPELKSAKGKALVHQQAYYTLNEIPK